MFARGGGGGGGGRGRYSVIFTQTYARAIFFLFKILNFNIFLGFQKNEYFFGV